MKCPEFLHFCILDECPFGVSSSAQPSSNRLLPLSFSPHPTTTTFATSVLGESFSGNSNCGNASPISSSNGGLPPARSPSPKSRAPQSNVLTGGPLEVPSLRTPSSQRFHEGLAARSPPLRRQPLMSYSLRPNPHPVPLLTSETTFQASSFKTDSSISVHSRVDFCS